MKDDAKLQVFSSHIWLTNVLDSAAGKACPISLQKNHFNHDIYLFWVTASWVWFWSLVDDMTINLFTMAQLSWDNQVTDHC